MAYRILYVDDEPGLLEIGRLYLEQDPAFSVETLDSATRALAALRSGQYEAIVSDYQMPDMDGITFLKALRARDDTTPFIIFTGKGREEVVIEALNSGADFYLQKGGDPEPVYAELAHKLHHAITRRQAHNTLKKRERDLNYLIENANEAIFIVQDEQLVMANPQASQVSGYSHEEIIGQPFSLFVHPDDREILVRQHRRRMAGEPITSRYSFRLCRRDGETRWVEMSVVAITWNDRPAILNFLIDITGRKLAEDALRESEARYRNFFRTTLDCVFITSPGGSWIDFNDAVVETFRFKSREEVFATPLISLYQDPQARARIVALVEKEGYVREHPISFRRRDGTIMESLMTVVSQKGPDGLTDVFIGSIRNIDERRKAEAERLASETTFRSIVECAFGPVLIIDMQGFVLYANNAVASLVDAERGEILTGKNVLEFVAEDSRSAVTGDLAKVKEGNDAFLARYRLISQKGNFRVVECIGKGITYEGKPADLISLQDVTDSKK